MLSAIQGFYLGKNYKTQNSTKNNYFKNYTQMADSVSFKAKAELPQMSAMDLHHSLKNSFGRFLMLFTHLQLDEGFWTPGSRSFKESVAGNIRFSKFLLLPSNASSQIITISKIAKDGSRIKVQCNQNHLLNIPHDPNRGKRIIVSVFSKNLEGGAEHYHSDFTGWSTELSRGPLEGLNGWESTNDVDVLSRADGYINEVLKELDKSEQLKKYSAY